MKATLRTDKVSGAFVIDGDISQVRAMSAFGFVWNTIVPGKFATKDPMTAAGWFGSADGETRSRLEPYLEDRRFRYVLSSAEAPIHAVDVPSPEGLSLLPFQLASVEYMMRSQSTMLADEMGLGKTIEVCGLISAMKKASGATPKTLIVSPASLKINWMREINKWCPDCVASVLDAGDRFPDAEIVVTNYDILHRYQDELGAIVFDLVVGDEARAIKNTGSRRSKAFRRISAKKKVLADGTPIPNRPAEFWAALHWLAPEQWPSWKGYVYRYCAASQTRFGLDISGASNSGELFSRLRETLMVRRTKAQVLKDLPPKFRQVLEIPFDDKGVITAELEAYDRWVDAKSKLKEMSKPTEETEEYRHSVHMLSERYHYAFAELSKARHNTARAKLPNVISHVNNMVESGQKVIVFAHHIDILNELSSSIPHSVVLRGEDSGTKRQEAVDAFQREPSVRVIVSSLKAGGSGYTMTEANAVVLAELDWTPSVITQAEDRAHRKGQKRNVLVQHLVLAGSLDARMAKMCVEKQKMIDEVVDGQTRSAQ